MLVARRETTTVYGPQLSALVRAHFAALAYRRKHPEDANQRTAPIFSVRPDDLTRAKQSVRDLLIADMSVMSPILLLAALLVWFMFRSKPFTGIPCYGLKLSTRMTGTR